MKITRFFMLGLACLAMSGCTEMVYGAVAGGVYASKREELPPAELSTAAAAHHTWCYRSLGTIDCYAEPLPNQGARLVNVDPESSYPLNGNAYDKTVASSPGPGL